MKHYAIFRVEKLKHFNNIRGSLKHNFREQTTPNADEFKNRDNQYLVGNSTEEVIIKIKNNIDKNVNKTVRKDAVRCLEYIITASPEWFKKKSRVTQDEYFNTSLEFITEQLGKENIVCATIHRDETTPHLVVYATPILNNSLNAKQIVGNKTKLAKTQTEFAEYVAGFGLERGQVKSKAKHTKIKEYYEALAKAESTKFSVEKLEKRKIKGVIFSKKETDEQLANRIANRYIKPIQKEAIVLNEERRRFELQRSQTNYLSKQIQSLNIEKQELTKKLDKQKKEEELKLKELTEDLAKKYKPYDAFLSYTDDQLIDIKKYANQKFKQPLKKKYNYYKDFHR